jgi:hypothetical protein
MTDEFTRNDTLRSSYAAPLLITGKLIVDLKTNVYPGENSWELRNANGEIISSRADFPSNTNNRDTLDLPPGCYEFQLLDEAQDGLSWWANTAQGNGVLRFRNETNGIIKTFNPDFGGEIYQQFVVQQATEKWDLKNQAVLDFLVFPNPEKQELAYEIESATPGTALLELRDLQGRILAQKHVSSVERGVLGITQLQSGLYFLTLNINGQKITRRFQKI